MNDWTEIRLKQLIKDIGDGATPSTTDPTNFGKGIPWVVIDDIKPEIWKTKEELTEKGFKACSAKKWPVDSIILSTGATIGEVGIAKVELCSKQGITGIIPNEYANYLFLRYWFEQNKVQLVRYAQGTTFKEIRPRTLGNLRIKIPKPFTVESLLEQQKIAAILTKVDDAIQAVKNTIEKAERLKKALMQNLLTGKLKPDGTWRRDDEFYESKIGFLSKNLQLIRAKDFCVKVTDGTHDTPDPTNDGYYLVTSKNLNGSSLDFTSCYYISERAFHEINKRSKVEQYDILFGMIGTVGNAQIIYQENIDFAIKNVGLFKMGGDIIKSKWLKNYFDSNIFNDFRKRQQAGTTQQFVSLGFLRKLPIPVPIIDDKINIATMSEINNKIDQVLHILKNKNTKLNKLERLKKALMQNLLTGKVRVKLNEPIKEQME